MKRPRIVDANGRAWDVYEFSIIAGKTRHFEVGSGSGAYHGFAPVDGGARRQLLLIRGEQDRPATTEVLLEQLAKSTLDARDDPSRTRFASDPPPRVDPPHVTPG